METFAYQSAVWYLLHALSTRGEGLPTLMNNCIHFLVFPKTLAQLVLLLKILEPKLAPLQFVRVAPDGPNIISSCPS